MTTTFAPHTPLVDMIIQSVITNLELHHTKPNPWLKVESIQDGWLLQYHIGRGFDWLVN